MTASFVVRNSASKLPLVNTRKEHDDTFRNVHHPDLSADTAIRVNANARPPIHSAGLQRSERKLLVN